MTDSGRRNSSSMTSCRQAPIVRGRDERLGQVFRNLIDNAVSFSPPGGKVIVIGHAQRHRGAHHGGG